MGRPDLRSHSLCWSNSSASHALRGTRRAPGTPKQQGEHLGLSVSTCKRQLKAAREKAQQRQVALRWALPGRGKRGGARVIYFWRSAAGCIYLLYAYAKNAQEDLSETQRKQLVKWIGEVFGGE